MKIEQKALRLSLGDAKPFALDLPQLRGLDNHVIGTRAILPAYVIILVPQILKRALGERDSRLRQTRQAGGKRFLPAWHFISNFERLRVRVYAVLRREQGSWKRKSAPRSAGMRFLADISLSDHQSVQAAFALASMTLLLLRAAAEIGIWRGFFSSGTIRSRSI